MVPSLHFNMYDVGGIVWLKASDDGAMHGSLQKLLLDELAITDTQRDKWRNEIEADKLNAPKIVWGRVKQWLRNNEKTWLCVFDNVADPAILRNSMVWKDLQKGVNGSGHVLISSRCSSNWPLHIKHIPLDFVSSIGNASA